MKSFGDRSDGGEQPRGTRRREARRCDRLARGEGESPWRCASATGGEVCGQGGLTTKRYLRHIFDSCWTDLLAADPKSSSDLVPVHCGAAAAGARSLGGVSTAGGRRRRVRRCVASRWTSRRRPCGAGASRSGCHPPRREEGWGIRTDGAAVRERQAGLGAAVGATRSTRRRYASAYARCERPTRATTAARAHRPPLPRRPRRRPPLVAARCRRGADPIDTPSTTRPRSTSTSPAGRSR